MQVVIDLKFMHTNFGGLYKQVETASTCYFLTVYCFTCTEAHKMNLSLNDYVFKMNKKNYIIRTDTYIHVAVSKSTVHKA